MTLIRKTTLLSAAALAGLLTGTIATPALAAEVKIRNFVGKVTITEGDMDVSVENNDENPAKMRRSGDVIEIDGGQSRKERGEACNYNPGFRIAINGWNSWLELALDDYPSVEITVPAGSDLAIMDSYVSLEADVALGTADLAVGGCFDTELSVADRVNMDKSGSGDFSADIVGDFVGEKSGSGDIEIDRVGTFELEQSGSGDVSLDIVTGHVDIEKSGSGDVEIDTIEGDFDIQKSGSGDVEVDSGEIPNLSVRNSGSGDVDIDAAVGNAYVRASGSGDVYVKSISGSLDNSTSGSADFSRGDD